MSQIPPLIAEYVARLNAAGISSAREDVEKIITHVLGLPPEMALTWRDLQFTPQQQHQLEQAIRDREARMPLARIFGQMDFYGLKIATADAVYRPYPESEAFIEHIQIMFEQRPDPITILDLGTGTGCILLALLQALPQATGVGIDIDERAIQVAQDNALRNQLDARAQFHLSDWGQGIATVFDVIVANPPRVATADLDRLVPEMRQYDPQHALDGGSDGIAYFRRCIDVMRTCGKPDGYGIFQFGPKYATAVQQVFAQNGYDDIEIKHNFMGSPVAIVVRNRAHPRELKRQKRWWQRA